LKASEIINLLNKVNNEIIKYIELHGYTNQVRNARAYFIDAIDALLDKKIETSIKLLDFALKTLYR